MQEVRLDRWPGGQLGPPVLLIYLHIGTNHKHIRGSSEIAPLNTTLREQISTQARGKKRNKRKGKTFKVLCLDKVRKRGKRLHNNMSVSSTVYRESESIKPGKMLLWGKGKKTQNFLQNNCTFLDFVAAYVLFYCIPYGILSPQYLNTFQ